MARPYRLQGEDCFYHIFSRGDDRKKIFISERDFEKFLEYIVQAKAKFKFYVCGYCLMANHYHLLIKTTQANISRIMHYINSSYTTYYNRKRKRCGHVFQGRFKSLVVDTDSYFLEVSRYIHLNPVRAKKVKSPEKYCWSSYSGFLGKKDLCLDKDKVGQYLDMDKKNYRRFVLEGIEKNIDPFKNIYAGFLLGSAKFIKEKLKDLGNQVEGKDVAHKQTIIRSISKDDIMKAVADKYKKTIEQICVSKSRPKKAKHVAIYLLRKYTELTNKEIGNEFGMKFSAVSKAALRIEQLIKQDKKLKQKVENIMSIVEG